MTTREAVIDTWRHLSESGIDIILDRPSKPWTEAEMIDSGKPEADAIFNRAVALGLEKRNAVLDWGCGIGRIAIALADRFEYSIGIEPSPAFRVIAMKWGHANNDFGATFHAMDAVIFDLIIVNIVWIHHSLPAITEDLLTLSNRLAPGGLIRFDVFTTEDAALAAEDAERIAKNAAGPKQSIVGAVYRPDLLAALSDMQLEIVYSENRQVENRLYEVFWVRHHGAG